MAKSLKKTPNKGGLSRHVLAFSYFCCSENGKSQKCFKMMSCMISIGLHQTYLQSRSITLKLS